MTASVIASSSGTFSSQASSPCQSPGFPLNTQFSGKPTQTLNSKKTFPGFRSRLNSLTITTRIKTARHSPVASRVSGCLFMTVSFCSVSLGKNEASYQQPWRRPAPTCAWKSRTEVRLRGPLESGSESSTRCVYTHTAFVKYSSCIIPVGLQV